MKAVTLINCEVFSVGIAQMASTSMLTKVEECIFWNLSPPNCEKTHDQTVLPFLAFAIILLDVG